ncbi:MAG: hypothetical protein OXL96_11065 [Candidatus Poribacteria bacterium]|nr:hypothetical protein [Candidatus Poribacteria bacterium]
MLLLELIGPTAPENHNNTRLRACYLSIAGAFFLLAIVFVVHVLSPSPPIPEPVKERTETEPRRVHRTPPPVFEVSETYYRTIIDNNLFRPLGWTPPRLQPPRHQKLFNANRHPSQRLHLAGACFPNGSHRRGTQSVSETHA